MASWRGTSTAMPASPSEVSPAATQGSIQPGSERLQWWGTHSFSRQPVYTERCSSPVSIHAELQGCAPALCPYTRDCTHTECRSIGCMCLTVQDLRWEERGCRKKLLTTGMLSPCLHSRAGGAGLQWGVPPAGTP